MFNSKKAGETDDTAVTNLNTATIWQRTVSSAQQLLNKVGQRQQQYTTATNNNSQSASTTGVTNDSTGKPLASSTSSTKTYGTGK